MQENKLFMVVLGCKPIGRYTEQHDVFFGIGQSLKSLIPDFYLFWPEAKKQIHIDSWREITYADGFDIKVVEKIAETKSKQQLFFLNLGGYKPADLEEYHYKIITVADNTSAAIKKATATAFYQHTGFKGAESHVDDKYGIDVDDIYAIEDILPAGLKEKYSLQLTPSEKNKPDELHIGYVKLDKLLKD